MSPVCKTIILMKETICSEGKYLLSGTANICNLTRGHNYTLLFCVESQVKKMIKH